MTEMFTTLQTDSMSDDGNEDVKLIDFHRIITVICM